jgi:hypothetical protein
MIRPPSFICPHCGARSYNSKDIEYGYCGACNRFTGVEPAKMKYRIRATFSPPSRWLRAGVLPEQLERFCDGHTHVAEELRALILAAERLLKMDARVVIEIMPAPANTDD